MKGIILNLVEDAVVAEHGAPVWDAVLDEARLDGIYTSLGNYPDGDVMRLLAACSDVLGVAPRELTHEVGRRAVLGLAVRYPHHFAGHHCLRTFLMSLDDVIHAEVRKLYPESRPPEFWFEGDEDDTLLVHYRSPRRLCALAVGMIRGAAEHYGETVSITHHSCMLDGADHCTLLLSFEI